MKVKFKMKKKLNIKKLFTYVIIPIIIIIFLLIGFYSYSLRPISEISKEIIFEVKEGETYSTIASKLEKENLIKSIISFKILVKIKDINHLETGYYKLNENMSANEILNYFEKGTTYNPDAISITLPEGKTITEIAKIIANKTGKDYNSYLTYWNSEEFKDKVIEKYWFVNDKIKNKNIRFGLEGYFFPSTYELQNKDVSAEYIAYKLLDQMGIVLNRYKTEISSSKYDIHQLLTLASIVEYEAMKDVDRPLVASVFYNRLEANIKLQSCATVGYAINEWKLTYDTKDLATNSLYNTYYYSGLPVGPGNSPSEKSIEAVINPETTQYYYFMSDVCHDGYGEDDKIYYAKTFSDHVKNVNKYLTCV